MQLISFKSTALRLLKLLFSSITIKHDPFILKRIKVNVIEAVHSIETLGTYFKPIPTRYYALSPDKRKAIFNLFQ